MTVNSQNKDIFGRLTQEDKVLGQLLTPSWLSGLFVVVISLATVIGTIVASLYRSSDFQYLAQLQSDKPHALANNYQTLNSGVTSNVIISDIPLFILWGGVGLIVYWCTMSLLRAFHKVEDLELEMNYVHANRHDLARQTVGTLMVRIAVLLTWFLYLQLTIHLFVPYAIAVAYAASGALSILYGAAYLLWGIGLLAIILHVHVVLSRLLFLRPRLFGNG
ncbi:MAG: hypothetical protein JWL89_431 [Candidatus Saccharibacteria bacterium]|nr:hypothetical protein [Candidatus Saccharibacteria bacterium]